MSQRRTKRREAATSASWTDFERELVVTLATMREDESLVLSLPDSGRYVQIMAIEDSGLLAEVSSNAFLAGKGRLEAIEELALAGLGWSPPTSGPDGSTPNFVRRYSRGSTTSATVARLVVRTLTDVFRVSDPAKVRIR